MPLTPAQVHGIATVERLLTDLFGTPASIDNEGKYPHRRLSWPDRGWADLYPQSASVALVTASIRDEHLGALRVLGVHPRRNKPNLTRVRLDRGFDGKALGQILKAVWEPPVAR